MRNKITLIHAILLFLITISFSPAENWQKILDLNGKWKFAIGDQPKWSESDLEDDDWTAITVPSSWEDQGFPGYDGFAWYRKKFTFTAQNIPQTLYLFLGRIDDVDEVYLNGRLIGSEGSFPPNYQTAYFQFREYRLPKGSLEPNKENVIAIRVFDEQLAGGILEGDVGIFIDRDELIPEINLAGVWKFRTGDSLQWKEKLYPDNHWREITVPGFWEKQGQPDYDGFAWYRLHFNFPANLKKQKLILLLGKIDDLDECFLNGQWIGRTGEMKNKPEEISFQNEYRELRAYFIPDNQLLLSEGNTLAVRVYDGYIDGGIYEGPIGIITRESYLKWLDRVKEEKWNVFKNIFK
jgi:beta-galactosidase/beta-glucuronidase